MVTSFSGDYIRMALTKLKICRLLIPKSQSMQRDVHILSQMSPDRWPNSVGSITPTSLRSRSLGRV